jgi:protocatechuate 3,4-dioxygenase beta subunit
MFSSKAKIATMLLLTMCVAATAFGAARYRAAAADPPAPPPSQAAKAKDQPKTETEATIEVRGQVLDPDGRPVAEAKLYLTKSTANSLAPAPQAKSGSDGRFRLAVTKSELDKSTMGKPSPQIMAVADGYGCDWEVVGSAEKELTLRLVKDMPIRGRILDPDGRPVVGAKVTVASVCTPKGDDLGDYLEAHRKGDGYAFVKAWGGALAGQPAMLTTGADGRFKLAGVGRERVVYFHVEGPAIATVDLTVMTRAAEKVGDVYGGSFDYVAVASRPIRGVVRDKTTGKPLAGASVGFGPPYTQWMAVTDKEGRYELLGLAKSPSYKLVVKPADGLYFERWAELKDTPGLDTLTGDIEMVQGGVTVRGKVTDKTTGKPIAQARVYYYPLFPNPIVNKKLDGAWHPRSEAITGVDGSYVLTVLPGQGMMGATAPNPEAYMTALVTPKEIKDFFKAPIFSANEPSRAVGENSASFIQDHHQALVLLEPGEKEEALVKDMTLVTALLLTKKGRVVGPDGEPVTGVTVKGLGRGLEEKTLKGAEFTVEDIDARVNRQLFFYHEEKKLGFFLKELSGMTPEPLIIKLQPCGTASGRIVDADGQPVAGSRVDVGAVREQGSVGARHQWVKTDKDGRFRFEGLVPGYKYPVGRIDLPRILAEVVVEPGKDKDLGDIKVDQ